MKNPTIRDIELNRIQRTPNDRTADKELVESIRELGVLQPVAVVAVANGFRPIYGTRRLDAARKAGLSTVPASVYPATTPPADLHVLCLVENIQRLDSSPIEQGRLFAELVGMGLPIAEVAHRVGRSPSYIAQRLQLATLPEHVRELLPPDYSPSAVSLLSRLPTARLVHVLEERPHVASSTEAAQDALRDGDDLDAAPFPTAGCEPCQKREERICLDGECYGEKVAAHVADSIAAIRKTHPNAPCVTSDDAPTLHLRELFKRHAVKLLRDERVATSDDADNPNARDAILLDGGSPKLVKLVPHARHRDGRANKPKTPAERKRFAAQSRAASLAKLALDRLDDYLSSGKPRDLDEKQLGHVALNIAHVLTGGPLSPSDAALVLLRLAASSIRASVRRACEVVSNVEPARARDLARALLSCISADPDADLRDLEKSAE